MKIMSFTVPCLRTVIRNELGTQRDNGSLDSFITDIRKVPVVVWWL